jgi:peptide/nickel transport system ATP-binding protein
VSSQPDAAAGKPTDEIEPEMSEAATPEYAVTADSSSPDGADTALVRVADLRATVGGKILVADIDFHIAPGEVLAIVGASGSGKTTIGSALLGALKRGVVATGAVEVAGVDVLHCAPSEVPAAYLPQHPAAVLNPVRRIGGVLHDIATASDRRRRTGGASDRSGRNPARGGGTGEAERITSALHRVGLDDPTLLRRFPHQLSGGQQQRLVLAQAFLCEAKLLVADEPTTGQDPGHRAQVAAELRLAAANGMAVVLLSHDLDLVEAISDDTVVLESGKMREHRPTAELFAEPRHDYTRRLLAARAVERAPAVGAEVSIRIAGRGLTVEVGRGHRILDGVDFEARQGECLAVIGASGSGKTTLARTVAGLQQATVGDLRLGDAPLPVKGRRRTRAERSRVQYVFQDARASFDEHRSIADQVARSAIRLRGMDTEAAKTEAERVLAAVGLAVETAGRRRDKLSGGQLQRAALARALAAGPEVLVCDEITSGLDAITQRGVLDLLAALKADGLTILLITHEQAVADQLADKVLRIEDGRAVES